MNSTLPQVAPRSTWRQIALGLDVENERLRDDLAQRRELCRHQALKIASPAAEVRALKESDQPRNWWRRLLARLREPDYWSGPRM